jgi:hypothetical protein
VPRNPGAKPSGSRATIQGAKAECWPASKSRLTALQKHDCTDGPGPAPSDNRGSEQGKAQGMGKGGKNEADIRKELGKKRSVSGTVSQKGQAMDRTVDKVDQTAEPDNKKPDNQLDTIQDVLPPGHVVSPQGPGWG